MPSINIRNKKLHYQDVGKGYPLLFGHSYLWTSDMWKPQLESLSKNFRCIATDLWDHGQSDHLGEDDYSLEQCADDHLELMRKLGINEFAMIGLSVGGMWGTHLALRYPQAVSHLILMGTFVGSEPKATLDQYFSMIDSFESAGCFSPAFVDSVVPMFFSPHTLEHKKEMAEAFHHHLCNIKPDQIPGVAKLGRIIFSREDLISRLKEITQPSLVIVGQDDIARPPAEAKLMADNLPNSTLHIIENAGHIANLEQPDQVTAILQKFLQDVTAQIA